mmetsp:Transcript_13706/g.51113  ORF Transcript_13706/g.51113 Transcript_13706/m.51113 type:complete len:128 (-) Transcript_13706:520-903(-)
MSGSSLRKRRTPPVRTPLCNRQLDLRLNQKQREARTARLWVAAGIVPASQLRRMETDTWQDVTVANAWSLLTACRSTKTGIWLRSCRSNFSRRGQAGERVRRSIISSGRYLATERVFDARFGKWPQA